ncbi:hypothetical protein KC660_00205, partial [Candidatus Dojkabacteria bacterium]|nr:hypothetical protein [Candidatus Dojkabacteria bacterium]
LFKIELDFSYKDKSLKLTKDFVAKTALLLDLESKKKQADPTRIQESLYKTLGIDSPQIYLSTSYVSQNQMNELNVGKDLQSAIQKAVLGNLDSNPYEALSSLKEEYRKMGIGLNSPAKYPGILKSLKDQITVEAENYKKVHERVQTLKTAYSKGDTDKTSVNELDEKIIILEKEFENQKVYEEATKEVDELTQKANELGRDIAEAENIYAQKAKLEESLINFKDFFNVDLDEIGERLSSINGELKVLNELVEEQTPEPLAIVPKVDKNKQYVQYGLTIATLLLGIIAYKLLDKWIALIVGILLSAVSYLITRFVINRKKPEKKVEVTEKEKEKIDASERLKLLNKEAEELLAKTNSNSSDEFFTNKAKFVALKEQMTEIQTYLDARLKGKSIDELKKEQNQVFTRKAEIEQTKLTQEVVSARVLPEDYLRKRRELDMLKLDKKKLEDELTASKVRIEDSEYSVDDLVRLQEKLEWLKNDYNTAVKRYSALELAILSLDKAIKDTLKGSNQKLKVFIEDHLPKLTDGKYEKVELDEDLKIQIFSNEKNDFVYPEELSAGTVDLIYLLARLAIIEMIDHEGNSPLIFDDPFVTFDRQRLLATKSLLQEISKKRQTFIFTCHDDYDKWGSLVNL